MYSSNNMVRAMSGFTVDQVSDEMVDLRRRQASYMLEDYLIADIISRTELGTLTDKEKFELAIGETELSIVLLCYTLALKYTMTKDNKSFTAGSGGVSYRDTEKNTDFLKMAQSFWEQAWQQMDAYVDGVPYIAGVGIDAYTDSGFRIVKNYDCGRSLVEIGSDPLHEINMNNVLSYLNGEIS